MMCSRCMAELKYDPLKSFSTLKEKIDSHEESLRFKRGNTEIMTILVCSKCGATTTIVSLYERSNSMRFPVFKIKRIEEVS